LIELAVAALAGTSVWLALSGYRRKDRAVRARLARTFGLGEANRLRRALPVAPLLRLGRRLPGDRNALSASLSSAGLEHWSADAVVGARFALAFTGLVSGGIAGVATPLVAPLLAIAGYRIPDAVIKARSRSRREDLLRDLPDAVDLLAVCTQAGLNLSLSLNRVAGGVPGVLGEELRRTVREIEVGVPRREALAGLAARTEVGEIEALAGILISAERFGTRVASSLSAYSNEMRARRRRQAEEQARRAPVKMLFPLVFLILPGFVLLTLVPLLLGTFSSLGF
jgi:tight adherence protein C